MYIMFIFEATADGTHVAFMCGTPRTRKVITYLPAKNRRHAQEMSIALNNLLIVYGDDTIHLWVQGEDYSKKALDKIAERHTKNELILENAIKIDAPIVDSSAKQDATT